MASTTQALVQALANSSSGTTNRVLSFASNVSIGDLLVCAVAYTSPAGQPAITDTQSNTWTEVGEVSSLSAPGGTLVNLILFWTIASATGSCTVTGSVAGITGPTNVWMVIGEFSGANELAIISGSTLGFGVNPPWDGSPLSTTIQAVHPPLTTPTNALMVVAATTGNSTATWSIDPNNNYYTIAAQSQGIVLAYATNMYAGAPFCDMTPPSPILDRTGDTSAQWVILTAPFTSNASTTPQGNNESFDVQRNQYPEYPYGPAQQQ